MNRIARTLTNLTVATGLATGLATGALALSATAAHAEVKPGPVIVLPPSEPQPPKGPGDIKVPTPDPQPPAGPGDVQAPPKKPQPPKGPKDLADAPAKPKDPKPADPGAEKPAQKTAQKVNLHSSTGTSTEPVVAAEAISATAFQAGGRTFDNGLSGVEDSVIATEEDGADLTWLIAGLGAAGASGLVLVAARRRRQRDEA